MNDKAIRSAIYAADQAEMTKGAKRDRFIRNVSEDVQRVQTAAYAQGHREGFGRAAKVLKSFMLENGISGAKVTAFIKEQQHRFDENVQS